jgi:DNA-binding FrmR family transcriptional regulator
VKDRNRHRQWCAVLLMRNCLQGENVDYFDNGAIAYCFRVCPMRRERCVTVVDDNVSNRGLVRLRRIEGQIKGMQRMVEERRYCMDVITQIAPAESATHKVSELILKNPIETCVFESLRSDDSNERKKKIGGLVESYSRRRAVGRDEGLYNRKCARSHEISRA